MKQTENLFEEEAVWAGFSENFRTYFLKPNSVEKDFSYQMHYHDKVEIYYLLEGECKFIVDGKCYFLKPSDIIFIPPRTKHKAIYTAENLGARFVISCDTSYFPESVQALFSLFDNYVESVPTALGNAEELFRKIHQEHKNPDELSDYVIRSHLASLVALIFRAKRTRHIVQVKSQSGFIESTISYIKENYSKHITLDDAAKNAAVSSTYLSRSFKKETGFRFNEYLVLYRLMQAEAMLVEYPEKTILEIAYECGFNDSNYFTIRFKKKYGYTPTELRNGRTGKKRPGAP